MIPAMSSGDVYKRQVYDGERPVGFLAVKVHNAFTAEVCVMGILKEYHRMGIGSAVSYTHLDVYKRQTQDCS